jgi:RNA polymerase sigma-70 factor, ECF subfamily
LQIVHKRLTWRRRRLRSLRLDASNNTAEEAAVPETLSSKPQVAEWTDEEVIAQVLDGNRELYEVLVRRHTSRLYRAAVSILRSASDAEDVVQDAFVSAFQHLGQFAGRAKFSTWLTRIAVHRALEVAQGRREESLDVPEQDYKSRLRSRGRSPEEHAARREANALLDQALARLPEIYRDVVVMRYLQESDTAETAENLNITESNVKVRLHRACTMMRRHLSSALGVEPQAGEAAVA